MILQKPSTKASLIARKKFYFQIFLLTMFTLRKQFEIPKCIAITIQFLLPIYPVFITLQCANFENLQKFQIFKLFNFVLRPDLFFESQQLFMITFFCLIIHKIIVLILSYIYHKSQFYERFLKLIQHNNALKLMGICFNVYQTFISNYLFYTFGLFCVTSLKNQIRDNVENDNTDNIFFNLITIILLIVESTISVVFFESAITHQVYGLERSRLTQERLICHVITLTQIFLVFISELDKIKYFSSILSMIQQCIIIYDLIKNCSYILSFQKTPILYASSINLSIHLQIQLHKDFKFDHVLLQIIICSLGIFSILRSLSQKQNYKTINTIFSEDSREFYQFKYAIIKLWNNDFDNHEQELIIKSYIAFKHRKNCSSIKCTFCQHYQIIFPNQSCGITSQIMKDFNQKQQGVFLNLIQQNWKFENQQILQYAYLLYDVNQCMKAIKLLSYLNQQIIFQENCSKKQSIIYSNDQIQSLEFQSLNQTIIQDDIGQSNLLNNQSPQKYQFSLLEKTKLIFILNLAKAKIYAQLGTSLQAAQQSYISEFIEKNIQQDLFYTKKEKMVFSILEQKLNLYKLVQTTPNCQDKKEFRSKVFTICHRFYKVEKDLKRSYQKRPSFKLHRIVTFFYAEVISDYKRAIDFFKNSNFFEANEIQFQQIKNFNINSQNIHYLILEIKDDMQTLKLVNYSSQFFNNFGDGVSKIDQIKFEDLLPNYLNSHHFNFVRKFFETGESKYYQMFEVSLIKNKYKLLTSINQCFSITNKFQNSNITFAVFIQQASSDQVYIFVDLATLKCTFTYNLLTLLGWFSSDIEQLCEQEQLYDFLITKIFPGFQKVIRTNKLYSNKLNRNILILPKPNYSFQTSRIFTVENQKLQVRYMQLECDLIIEKRKISNYEYFIINVLRINEQNLIRELHSFSRFPPSSSKFSDEPHSSQFDFDNQDRIKKINAISFKERDLPNSIIVCKDSQLTSPKTRRVSFSNNFTSLLSPKPPTAFQENQQQFFADAFSDNEVDDICNNNSSHTKIGKKKKHKHVQKTTIGTDGYFSNEKVGKKYELIKKVLQVGHPKYLQKLMFFVVIWHAILLLFILLFYYLMSDDILMAKYNMEMSTFYYAIMAPHDLFFSMRVTITGYQQMQREGFLSKEQTNLLTQPYYANIDLGYTDLRDNLYEQLNNKYLQDFLNDVTVSLNFMKDNEKQIYPIEMKFRDALFVILQYQYSQMMTFYHFQSTSGQPFQISLFANYFMLHNQCEKLTKSIQSYSTSNSQSIYSKWQIVSIMGGLLIISLYLIIHFNQMRYFSQIDKLFQLTSSLTQEMIKPEIKKYQNFIDEYKYDRHYLDTYEPFDYFYSYFQKLDTEKQKKFTKIQNISLKHSRSINYLILILLLLMMLLFFILNLVNFRQYMSKYDDTLNLYLQLQDLKLRSGSLYLYREILFRWQNFTFLTEDNKSDLYSMISKAELSIDQYINMTSTLVFSNYLLEDSFTEEFQTIAQQYFCDYVDQKFINLSSRYCEIAFEGSIKKGLIQTLNYINHAIQTQQAINNFTKRVVAELYEQEGSQIVTRIFFALCELFNENTQSQTNNTINEIQILSYFFIAYLIITITLFQLLYKPYLIWMFKSLKRIVYLIPFFALVQSENLEIQLRELTYQLQLN